MYSEGRVHFTHVYGHIGLQYDEKGDQLATEAAKRSVVQWIQRVMECSRGHKLVKKAERARDQRHRHRH